MERPPSAVAGETLGLTLEERLLSRALAFDPSLSSSFEFDDVVTRYAALVEGKNEDPSVRESSLLILAAEEQLRREDPSEAERLANAALEQLRASSSSSEARGGQDAFRLRAAAKCLLGSAPSALEEAKAELEKCKQAKDRRGETVMAICVGSVHQSVHKHDAALQSFADALEVARSTGDKQLEATTLALCVKSHLHREFPEEAQRDAAAYVALKRELKDLAGEAKALLLVASVQVESYQLDDALATAKSALQLTRDGKLPALEASSLRVIAKLQLLKERPRAAGQAAEEALELSRRCSGEGGVEDLGSVDVLVQCLLERGDVNKAVKTAEAAVATATASGNKRIEAITHRALSKAYLARHDFEGAIDEANAQIDCYLALSDSRQRASALLQLSETQAGHEDGAGALASAEAAETLFKSLRDVKGQAIALYGQIFPQILCEDFDTALDRADAARELFQDVGERRWDGRTLWASAAAHARLKDFSSAVAAAKEALLIFEEVDDKRGIANAFLVVSEMQELAGEHEQSLKAAQAAQSCCRTLGHRRGLAAALQREAVALLAQDKPDKAAEKALEAKALYRRTEDRSSETALLHLLAQMKLEKGAAGAKELENVKFDSGNKQKRRNVRQCGREVSRCSRQALCLSTLASDKLQEAVSLVFLAQSRLLNGRPKAAGVAAGKAEGLFALVGDKVQEARAVAILAQAQNLEGASSDKVRELATKALDLARRAGDYQAEEAAINILEDLASKETKPPAAIQNVEPSQAKESEAEAPPAEEKIVPKGLDPEEIRPKVMAVVKAVTGAEEDDVDLDTPLMDLGMDSLSSIAFRNELNRLFQGINLPASLMFDYPNISQITDHIAEQTSLTAG